MTPKRSGSSAGGSTHQFFNRPWWQAVGALATVLAIGVSIIIYELQKDDNHPQPAPAGNNQTGTNNCIIQGGTGNNCQVTVPTPPPVTVATSSSVQPAPSATTVDVPGLAPFVGSWHAHASGLEIESSGSGSLTYGDISACPNGCAYGDAPAATTRFLVTSVSNGAAAGTVIATTDIEHDKVGEQVLITLGTGLQGKGVVLVVDMGKMRQFQFCNQTSTNYCGG